jgi:hypothetical protein
MIQWVLTAASLTGNMFNCLRWRMCFMIWIVCNIGWTVIDVQNGAYSRAILDTVQICFSVFGYIEWGKHEDIGHIRK